MNRDDVTRWAREADLTHQVTWHGQELWLASPSDLERFSALVAAAEREAKDELLAALQDLLMDTQHSEHVCGDKNCPVANAKAVALKYDAIRTRGNT